MKEKVLITGASSGIGKAFAEHYAQEGRDLLLVARSKERLTKVSKDLHHKFNVKVEIISSDLSVLESGSKIYEYVCEQGIFIDIIINCAGFGLNGTVNEIDYNNQHDEVMLNVVSVFDLTKKFLKPMIARNKGTIINVASSSAYHPIPTMAVYAASKAFVLSFTEALAVECQNSGVKVIAISPGATDTNFFSTGGGVAVGNLRTPSHVVDVTMKALSKNKISQIDGINNYFTSAILPRILPRKAMVNMVYRIMKKQANLKG
ncbi:SDR family NAD(P)-dependent oxidoreductase [Xylocopilactobacillus apis]|uniref:Short-chain dehydrogenase n=1 Tax=Xylocopilactobacillus apis TaxID=2932183 RepID=A0AAU9CWH5_9LACO|nr:SDR family oxidoreductase [Xylocopilactobacillus apis]BDR55704.1 short-chain dehydrogenase [Xylocopilactobacillus apis]